MVSIHLMDKFMDLPLVLECSDIPGPDGDVVSDSETGLVVDDTSSAFFASVLVWGGQRGPC